MNKKTNFKNERIQGVSALAAAAAALSLLLAGCASGPVAGVPANLAATPSLPAQWQQLSVAAPAEGTMQTDAQLAALQEQALRANRDIALALKRWERAQQQLGQSQLERGLKPSLSGSASGSRALEQGPLTRSYSLNASVGYEVDLWQRLAHGEAAQAAQVAGQRGDWAAAQLLIRNRVAESYWSLAALALEEPLIRRAAARRRGGAGPDPAARARRQAACPSRWTRRPAACKACTRAWPSCSASGCSKA